MNDIGDILSSQISASQISALGGKLLVDPGISTRGFAGYVDMLANKSDVVNIDVKKNPVVFRDSVVIPETASDLVTQLSGQDWLYAITCPYGGGAFGKNTSVVLPLKGLMNCNLGAVVTSATATRGVEHEQFVRLFNEDELLTFLHELDYRGFVSLLFNEQGKLVRRVLGIPELGNYCIAGLVKRKVDALNGVLGFMHKPSEADFIEAWSVATLISRYPYPIKTSGTEDVVVEGLDDAGVSKHFWPFFPLAKTNKTRSLVLGVATGWTFENYSSKLHVACDYALRTARAIKCPEIQYRTDLFIGFGELWARVKSLISQDE